MTLWELLWADARKQLLQRRQRLKPAPAYEPLPLPLYAGSFRDQPGVELIRASAGNGYDAGGEEEGEEDESDPKAALKLPAKSAAVAVAPGQTPGQDHDPEEESSFLAAAFRQLFVHFVAAVVVSQRRRVLDECTEPDDAMRLFHSLRGFDFWECVSRATVLRAAGASRKNR